eukprot:13093460-Alexandrium_andersonii.AAC.1
MASLAGASCARMRITCCPGAAVRPTLSAAMRQPSAPTRIAPAMAWPGMLRPSCPHRHGRPMNSISSK